MAWVWERGAFTIALMTAGTLSTSAIPVTPPSVWTRTRQLSYDPSKVAPVQPGVRSSITSMSVIFIAPSFVAPVCAIV
jgi:hypothetical protein